MTTTSDRPDRPDPEELVAELDAERPARRLPPWLDRAVSVVAALLSAYVLLRVFVPDPRGALPYRMTFLAVVLPLTFLV